MVTFGSFHCYGKALKFFFTRYLINNKIYVLLINLLAFIFAINVKIFFKGFFIKNIGVLFVRLVQKYLRRMFTRIIK
jgi:hypothetical protein